MIVVLVATIASIGNQSTETQETHIDQRQVRHKSNTWSTISAFPWKCQYLPSVFRSASIPSVDKPLWISLDNATHLPLPKLRFHPLVPWWFVMMCNRFLLLRNMHRNAMQGRSDQEVKCNTFSSSTLQMVISRCSGMNVNEMF